MGKAHLSYLTFIIFHFISYYSIFVKLIDYEKSLSLVNILFVNYHML